MSRPLCQDFTVYSHLYSVVYVSCPLINMSTDSATTGAVVGGPAPNGGGGMSKWLGIGFMAI